MVTKQPMQEPATRADVAFAAAHASLAIREIVIALMEMNAGRNAAAAAKIADVTKQADALYEIFQDITKRV